MCVLLLAGALIHWHREAAASEIISADPLSHLVSSHLYSSPDVVISQIYGGGGERGAPLKHDFIELFNRGATTVNLSGWSVQYATARNIGWQATGLSGTLAPGQYYLVRMASGGTAGADLPEADVNGTVALNATAGRVAVVRDTAPLSGLVTCPTDAAANGKIVDFVGYGSTVICAEGAAAPTPSLTLSVLRRSEGCQDTDQNGADFVTGTPRPRNTTTPLHPCNGVTTPQADLVITTVTSSSAGTQTSGTSLARFAQWFDRATAPAVPTQTSGASVPARGLLTFFLTVRNNGPASATNVIVSDTLPAGFSNLQASNGAVISGSTVTWPAIASLQRGASLTFRVTAMAPERAANGFNVARCTSDTYDPDLTNNRSVTPVTVLAGARFRPEDVKVEFSNQQACVTSLTVEVSLTNSGFTPQPDNTDAEFVANLPAALTVGSCFASKGTCRTNSGSHVVRWDGAINVNETVVISFTAQVLADFDTQLVQFCLEANVKYDADNDGSNEAVTSLRACSEYVCNTGKILDEPFPAESEVSAQKPGSILIYNYYSSNAADPGRENTRISITNTDPLLLAFVHLFFINGDSCEVGDLFLCLTPNQTTSFLASDIDPGVTGYLVAVAVNEDFGCPINFNSLIGDAYVKLPTGHAACLNAESIAAVSDEPVVCDPNNLTTAELLFDGVHYNRIPRTLALSNVTSLLDGNSTFLVLNRIGGNLGNQAAAIGNFAGWLFDDVEHRFSFTANGGCQFRRLLSNYFPRTSPRLSQVVPSGRAGWMKFWAVEDFGLLGAAINFNPYAAALVVPTLGGQNLHKLTLTNAASLTIPIVRPKC